ncbi:hypothetical protein AMECASPLE_019101, partial [Ameca splendens]
WTFTAREPLQHRRSFWMTENINIVQAVPMLAERHSPSSVSWAIPGPSSRWDVPGGVQEASGIDARATSTGASRCGGAAALLRAPPRWLTFFVFGRIAF